MFRRAVVMAAFALTCALAPSAEAKEPSLADTPPAEARMLPYTGVLPACDDGFALARIQRAFTIERATIGSPASPSRALAACARPACA